MKLKGVYPIVPTPFDDASNVRTEDIQTLARFMVEKQVSGLAVLGVMGEGDKLGENERAQVITTFRRELVADKGLVVGVRAAGTELAKRAASTARDLGADAVLLGPPPVQNDEAIFSYYRQVANDVGIPIIVHDYPAATKIFMSVDLLAEMVREIEQLKYIKLEDPPTGPKMDKLRDAVGASCEIFGALGGMYIFEELDRGAVGIMTGFAYPEFLVDIYNLYMAGEKQRAMTLFYEILPLIRFEFQPGIGISLRKHILKRRGVFKTTSLRHPGQNADDKTLEHLDLILSYLKSRGHNID